MKAPIVFMYSGQGAQYYQMGKELYDQNPVFQQSLQRCAEIVEPLIGASLVDVIYSKRKSEPFAETRYTHPANVAVCYALTQVLYSKGIRPDYLLGYSLGEFICAIVAGAISLEEALTNITRQALLLEEKTENATMMAILEDPAIVKRRPDLFEGTELACYNFRTHFVITGYQGKLKQIETTLMDEGVTAQILPISHGFHSSIIDGVEQEMIELIGNPFGANNIPSFSCMTKGTVSQYNAEHLWKVIRQPVRFLETLIQVEARYQPTYIDVGPAGTLTTFVKYALGQSVGQRAQMTINQFGRDQRTLEMLTNALK